MPVSPEMRALFAELLRDNGALVYDDEDMVCRSCGAQGGGAQAVRHDPQCLLSRLQRLLTPEELDAAPETPDR